MNLALFDFDGTISNKDSFLGFMRAARPIRFVWACLQLSPQIVLFLAGKYPNQLLKEAFLTAIFSGCSNEEIDQLAEAYCQGKLKSIIRPKALTELEEYKRVGDRVVVVTASPRRFLQPWCREMGLEILGSELELNEKGQLTGKLVGANCRGEEKVRRIRQYLRPEEYERISVYGDTDGDLEMLKLASEGRGFFKPFREI